MNQEEEHLDADEWKEELKEVLDNIDKKGDFCVGKDITCVIPRFQPSITVDGLDGGDSLAFPLTTSQAKALRSVAEKAPFGFGLDTVLDESVRKAWQIDATKVHFRDAGRWQSILQSILSDVVASLGMSGPQVTNVRANLYKMLLYEEGGFFKKHRDTEKEPGMFGTLVIQLPSDFTGGALVVEHAGEKKTFDYSSKSREGIFATAFYADCEHELRPVKSGWRLCLAYNLVISQNSTTASLPLPTANDVTAQLQEVQKLASDWNKLLSHPLGYMLEHDYTETNLHFANLKGRDKEVVEFLRGARGQNENPLFVVCLMLIEKHESGMPESRGYGYRRRGYDSESEGGDHTMEEVYETDIDIKNWIGPDDKEMRDFRLRFSIDDHLLSDEDTDEMFGEDPSRQEYESYTGNAGPTLDYWYHRAAVVFWPRSMNMSVVKSAGDSYLVSYLNVALPSEISELGKHVINLVQAKKLQVSSGILTGFCKSNDEALMLQALKCCQVMPNTESAQVLARVPFSFDSTDLNGEILRIVKNSAAGKKQHTYSNSPLAYAIDFLEELEATKNTSFMNEARENLVLGAAENIEDVSKCTKIDFLCRNAFQSELVTFRSFCAAVKSKPTTMQPILKSFISIGSEATKHPLIIELAAMRAQALKTKTSGGPPPFSWKMPHAVFPGSNGQQVTPFLRGNSQAQIFYGFNGIGHARNWASKYFGYGIASGRYSARAQEAGRGSDAYVTVTKTRVYHDAVVALYNKNKNELAGLVGTFGDTLGVADQDNADAAEGSNRDSAPSFTWRQPHAKFPGSNANEVNAFLRGDEETKSFYHFNNIAHAENWAYKYFGGHGQGTGYSASAVVGRNDSGVYVTVTKSISPDDSPPQKRLREF